MRLREHFAQQAVVRKRASQMGYPQYFVGQAKVLVQPPQSMGLSWKWILQFHYKRKFPRDSWNQSFLRVLQRCIKNHYSHSKPDIAFDKALLLEIGVTSFRYQMDHKLQSDQMDFFQFLPIYHWLDPACSLKKLLHWKFHLLMLICFHELNFQELSGPVWVSGQVFLLFISLHICLASTFQWNLA